VPAAAYQDTNIVNGMSLYQRDGNLQMQLCSGVHPDTLIGRKSHQRKPLTGWRPLKRIFYRYSDSFQVPFSRHPGFYEEKRTVTDC